MNIRRSDPKRRETRRKKSLTHLVDVDLGKSDRNPMNLVEIEDKVDEILELLVPAKRREGREAFEEVVVEMDLEEFPTILIA